MNQINEKKTMQAARVFHPGEFLIEELEERQLTQAEFSQIIDRPPRTVNEIIKGKRSITPETAGIIAAALGTTPDYWLALQSEYDLFILNKKSKEKDQDVRERADLYNNYPIADLVRRGYIKSKKRASELLDQLNNLFAAELESIRDAAFLRASEGDINRKYMKAWLALGKKLAKDIKLSRPYDKKALSLFASELKRLSADEQAGVKNVIERLNDLGVRIVILPHFSKTRADGAAFWLNEKSPVIMLSLRFDRIDNFYFTLLHEIGHLLLHDDRVNQYFTDDDIYIPHNDIAEENEANDFANTQLGFIGISQRLKNKKVTSAVIQHYSAEYDVHPGLLVGHLQHQRLIDYKFYRHTLIGIKSKLPKEVIFP